jgi:hypothetical protein
MIVRDSDELAIREARLAELHDLPARRTDAEELVAGMPGMTTWTSSPRPAQESRPASVARTDYPWRVIYYPDEPARHRHGYWTRRRSPGSYVVTRARVEQPRY